MVFAGGVRLGVVLASAALLSISESGTAPGSDAITTPMSVEAHLPSAKPLPVRRRFPDSALPAKPPQRTIEPFGVGFWSLRRGLLVLTSLSRKCARGGGGCRGGFVELTSDGGRTWKVVQRLMRPLDSVSVATRSVAWATIGQCGAESPNVCGSRRLLVSSDGGEVWKRVVSSIPVTSISALSGSVAWAVAVHSRPPFSTSLVRTTDGGHTWRVETDPCRGRTTSEVAAVNFPSAVRGWTICVSQPATGVQPKALVSTSDGGATWELRSECAPQAGTYIGAISCAGYFPALQMRVDGRGWLWLVRNGLSSTVNSGRKWRPVAENVVTDDQNYVLSASLVSDSVGFMLISSREHDCPPSGCGPQLLETLDAGLQWTRLHSWPPWP